MNLSADDAKILNDFNGTLAFKRTPMFKQFMQLNNQIIAFFTGNRFGKSVAVNHLKTMTYDGRTKKIKDIKKGDVVLSLNEDMKIVPAKVLDWIDSGVKPGFKALTRLGNEFISSADHGYLTVDGWKRLGDIKPGDYIATPRKLDLNLPDNERHKDWEYILMGYLVGDGGMNNRAVYFTNNQQCTIDEIRGLLRAGYELKYSSNITYRITHGYSGEPNFYLNWVRKHDMNCLSIHKFVPTFVQQSSNRQVALFLSRLFSCDGCVETKGTISYCSASRDLIMGVKDLLLRFGIVAKVRTKHPKLNGKVFTAYEIQINRHEDIINFSEQIGIYSKQDKLDKVVEWSKNKQFDKPNKGHDIVPVTVNRLYDQLEREPANIGKRGPQSQVKYPHQYNMLRESRGKTIYRDKLKKIAEEFKDEFFSILANSDVYWDKVESITPVGNLQMCDLEVEEHHNFLAEGVFTHNSHSIVMQYIYRFLSIHPVPEKNVVYLECQSRYCKNGHKFDKNSKYIQGDAECPKCDEEFPVYIDKFSSHKFGVLTDLDGKDCPICGTKIEIHRRATRVYRFCAENQPNEKSSTGETYGDDGQSAETRNTLYPALKKWLPNRLIEKDITARNPNIYIKDIWGGPNIIVEFVSYNQSVQSTAGFSLCSINLDEEAPLDFYLEQLPRLIEENGDVLVGCTPANKMSYYYDDIFLKAKTYIRTPVICRKFGLKRVENTDSPLDIAVLQASSYDNPILDKGVITRMFDNISEEDADTLNIRLYGMFAQASGRVFKDFNINIHVVSKSQYFSEGIPNDWVHGRFIDYHSHNPWACVHISLSPWNEAFVWGEYQPISDAPTRETLEKFLPILQYRKSRIDLVDSFAEAVKKDGVSVKDDMNAYSKDLVKEIGCSPANWKSWDSKSTRGRDEIKYRLKNARICGKPFDNKKTIDGVTKRLPTLWVLDDCPHTYKSLRNWKYEAHINSRARVSKDPKEQPEQKWSHFCMCIEAAFKEKKFKPMLNRGLHTTSNVVQYFRSKYN